MIDLSFWAEHILLYYIFMCLLGLIMGSFLNVVIYRLPIMLKQEWTQQCQEFLSLEITPPKSFSLNLLKPASHCPSCSHRLRFWENIPLLSYMIMLGRCSHCKTKISPRYPLIELMTAILTLIVVFQFGMHIETLWMLIFTWSLIALSAIDLEHQILPDSICLPLLWIGLILSSHNYFTVPTDAILGSAVAYLSLWGLSKIFKLVTHKEGMGHGDFKLFAALGAWFGWQMLPLIIILSTFVGSIIGILLIVFKKHRSGSPIPFGPFLAAAGWIAAIWGIELTNFYLSFLGFHTMI